MRLNLKKATQTVSALLLTTAVSMSAFAEPNVAQDKKWAASFAFSPQGSQILRPPFVAVPILNQTVRSIVHLSLGGDKIRVRISNAFGDKPLTIDAASVGVRETDSTIVAGTIKTLTFGGESSIIIPMGTDIFTDPVSLNVANDSDLAINLFITAGPVLPTIDDVSNKTSYISVSGDATNSELMPAHTEVDVSYFTSGVDVLAKRETRTIVIVGASTTDGYGSDMDASNNYPSNLARRLLATPEFKKSSVVNAAISGNRLLAGASYFGPSMMARMEKDILAQSGVTHIILSNGNNDIGLPEIADRLPGDDTFDHVTAAQLIAGLKQMIVTAHSRNIKIIGGTFLPYKGSSFYSELGDEKRQLVNQWIRTSGAFDGYVDFDLVLQDPTDPLSIRADLQIGDNSHPNAAGYQVMADAIDLNLLK